MTDLRTCVSVCACQLGDPKDTIRASVRNIFRELYKIYPASKVFLYVMDGLKSKNGRQRAGGSQIGRNRGRGLYVHDMNWCVMCV